MSFKEKVALAINTGFIFGLLLVVGWSVFNAFRESIILGAVLVLLTVILIALLRWSDKVLGLK